MFVHPPPPTLLDTFIQTMYVSLEPSVGPSTLTAQCALGRVESAQISKRILQTFRMAGMECVVALIVRDGNA